MPRIEKLNNQIYIDRRIALKEKILAQYPEAQNGIILLFANFEQEQNIFKQDSSFYYLTGINEPATALLLDLADDTAIFYMPNFGDQRKKWVKIAINNDEKNLYGFTDIAYLGEPCTGYQCHPFFSANEYSNLLNRLQIYIDQKRPIYTFNPQRNSAYLEQRFILQRINSLINNFAESLIDISALVAQMRRKKTTAELELLYKAIDITMESHLAVARMIKAGKYEYEMQALIEYMFIATGGSIAFPSIVASGKDSTVLHYHDNNKVLEDNQLVVVDIGAEYNHYCADLTRTYPVSGKFTDRQREIYEIVLETQEFIANTAQPGYWLANKDQKDKSLHHIAQEFLEEKGYNTYFIHGIGHFLGLDVHDVGDYMQPLAPGDVITIEPGIYLPDEDLGVRIEDNYWIVEDGAICLSEELPKQPDVIEEIMRINN
ncbi:MAG: aminopeptidase P N-terminal domain-containing protein [Candidatus Babeliales bacterium]